MNWERVVNPLYTSFLFLNVARYIFKKEPRLGSFTTCSQLIGKELCFVIIIDLRLAQTIRRFRYKHLIKKPFFTTFAHFKKSIL